MVRRRARRRRKTWVIIILLLVIFLCVGLYAASYWNLLPEKSYTAEDFGITTVKSPVDYNENGVDDYTDILLGARKDAVKHPTYDGRYWDEGYPPDDIGVCTDVVWRAFKNAGYCLRDMVNNDIAARPEAYDIEVPDGNIDFRRVGKLHIFFEEYALSLTLNIDDIGQWQPGDIIIFGDDDHIGIISDKRNEDGKPYVIHNGGQPSREENYFSRTSFEITGHYRFDASLIDSDLLVAWQEE